MDNFNVILFDNFESLDVFGAVEVIGKLPKYYQIDFYSLYGGMITSSQNSKHETLPLNLINSGGILLVPG